MTITSHQEEPLLVTTLEKAKQKLFIEITEGRLSDDIPPGKVWDDDDDGGVYKACKRQNFTNNLRELRKRINKWQKEAESDKLAAIKDRAIFPIDMTGRWPDSKAEKSLKIDVANGEYPSKTPIQLYNSEDRKEYREFEYSTFRRHIHQEIRSRHTTTYWVALKAETMQKKAKKGARKEQKLRQIEENVGKPLSERDLDSMTKAEMKDLCKEMGLKVSGNKNDLSERIKLAQEKNKEQ
jgi:hypothetical protein